ncbi:hypothetical protein YC2023_010831 [Brassica napus]
MLIPESIIHEGLMISKSCSRELCIFDRIETNYFMGYMKYYKVNKYVIIKILKVFYLRRSYMFGPEIPYTQPSYRESESQGVRCVSQVACVHEIKQINSVNLLDNQEYIEGISTPSTKRNEAWTDTAPDITSTSKNLCSKFIKVEKMSDLEFGATKNTYICELEKKNVKKKKKQGFDERECQNKDRMKKKKSEKRLSDERVNDREEIRGIYSNPEHKWYLILSLC